MAYFNGTVFSETLCMMTDMAVIIPENGVRRDENGDYPVLFLLHGLSDNHTAWSRRTMVDLYAEELGVAVVMPEIQRGFYQDMDYGLPYFRYISEELPQICHKLFRTTLDASRTFVAGLSMGGYGALRCGLTYPERFAAVGCSSSETDLDKFRSDNPCNICDAEKISIFGHNGPGDDEDLFVLAAQSKTFPPIYQVCGESDFLLENNRAFDAHLTKLGVNHIYEEWPGAHEWRFWNTAVEKFMRYFATFL